MLALGVMMAVTIVDVGMRLVLNELVLGSVEVVELALVCVVFLALPETFIRDEQVTVDVVDQLAGPRARRWLERSAALATAVLLVVMAVRTVPPALDTLEIGDLTSDLQLRLLWYWLPLVLGAVVAALAAIAMAVAVFRRGPERG